MWPWSKIRLLEAALAHERARNKDLLWRCELRENLMLKALREQAAAHKGIRRLRAKLDSKAEEIRMLKLVNFDYELGKKAMEDHIAKLEEQP